MISPPDAETAQQQRERFRAVNIAWMEQRAEAARSRLSLASELAITGLKALNLINGGAIVALFTLLGQHARGDLIGIVDRTKLIWAFGSFSGGLVFSLVANVLGYWSQQKIALYEQETVNHTYVVLTDRQQAEPKLPATPNGLLVAAVGSALASLTCFILGSLSALLGVLPPR